MNVNQEYKYQPDGIHCGECLFFTPIGEDVGECHKSYPPRTCHPDELCPEYTPQKVSY